jgi:hypothetical protein
MQERRCVRQWLGQEDFTTPPAVSNPPSTAGQREHRSISRIPTRRDADIEANFSQSASCIAELPPRPTAQLILVPGGGPGSNERNHTNVGPEPRLKLDGEWFREQPHVEALARAAQERGRQGEVTKSPQLDHEESLLHHGFRAIKYTDHPIK